MRSRQAYFNHDQLSFLARAVPCIVRVDQKVLRVPGMSQAFMLSFRDARKGACSR